MFNPFQLEDKGAIVTGGARGIGRGIAETFCMLGANVAIADLTGSLETATELQQLYPGSTVIGLDVDVRDFKQVENFAATTYNRFGTIDVLVNNAGTASRSTLDAISSEDWQRDLDTNVNGTFNFTKAVIYPYMSDNASGSIINVSSISGINGGASSSGTAGARSGPAYAASKGGIIALTKWVAKEVGHLGIRCNSVAPGPVKSAMTEGQAYDLSGQVLQHMGEPTDIANAVAFLASPAASYITGQILRVDGGAVIA